MKNLQLIILLFIVNLLNAQVGIGTVTPGNTLEINSGTEGTSGLRFTQLNSSSATASNTEAKVLGLDALGDIIFTTLYPQVVSVNAILDVNTPANTTLTLGEIQFRTDKTGPGVTGDIQIRSSSSNTLVATILGHEEYNGGTTNYTAVSATLNTNSGAFTTFFAGGLNSNELLVYRIVTNNGGFYRITLVNRNNIDIFIIGEKLK